MFSVSSSAAGVRRILTASICLHLRLYLFGCKGMISGFPFLLPQLSPQILADFRFWEHISEFDILGNLVVSQPVLAPPDEFVSCHALDVFFQDNKGLYPFSNPLVRNAHRYGSDNGMVVFQHCLNLRGGYTVAFVLDDVSGPVRRCRRMVR